MKVEVTDLAQQVVGAIKADAPVDVARLKNSISFKQEDLTLTFYASADYAPYMEWGTKSKVKVPGYVGNYASQFQGRKVGGTVNSRQAIKQWASKKGVQDWGAVWWHIMKFGVKPHPFFFTTKSGQNRLEIIKDKYKAALKQGLKNLIK